MQNWFEEARKTEIKESEYFPKELNIDLNDRSMFIFFKIIDNYIKMVDVCKKINS